jgi:DNA-binding beta-propeller fold protein YncE
MIKGFPRFFSLSIMVLLFTGCAAKKPVELIWPGPPDQPRIRFDKSFNGAKAFYGTSAMDIILGDSGVSSFSKPNGVHVDKEGRIYVSDTGFGMVIIFDSKAKAPVTLESGGSSPFNKPVGITTDPSGNIYVSDTAKDRVLVFDKDRNFVKGLGMNNEFKQPVGIAVDPTGKRIYVVDTHSHHIAVLDLESGEVIKNIGKRGKEEGEFNFPSQITVDPAGNVYVVDTMNGRVQIFDKEGRFMRAFGKLGDGPGMFARPKGIALDSEGHIYVVDSAFNNVQIFNSEGEMMLGFGGFGEGRGQQILPAGLSIDSEDKIYVIDQWNARVNIFEYMGEKYKARQGKK